MIGNSNDDYDFTHKLLYTNTQAFRLCKDFESNKLANIKLSKIQLHKKGQSGRFFRRLLRTLMLFKKNWIGWCNNIMLPNEDLKIVKSP